MKKILIGFVFLVGVLTPSLAQQAIMFSQYMNNLIPSNPAAVGHNDMINVGGSFRSQYAGFEGAPIVYNVGADIGFNIAKTKHGAGINFYDNTVGLFRFQDVNLDYAYRIPIKDGYLSAGISINFTTVSYDTERLHTVDSEYHSPDDPSIAQANGNDFKMDLGAGVLFKNKTWFAGISILNILAPQYRLSNTSETNLFDKSRNLIILGGYNISFTNPLYKLKVSAAINTDFASWSGIANANLEYKERYWGGLGYRIDGAVIFMVGIRVLNGLNIAYSFDLPTSSLINSAGSHEVSLSYSFNIDLSKKNKYKSIRYL
ncbi:MAG: PorP/SprF family type IX secretion system membrane protein [Paludibacteraceae bacterium]|nr:PorP/SprF family type IX secretion system membrane protein [Paludibacteraceae bacterium]